MPLCDSSVGVFAASNSALERIRVTALGIANFGVEYISGQLRIST